MKLKIMDHLLPVTELVDKYYGEVQGMGGNVGIHQA